MLRYLSEAHEVQVVAVVTHVRQLTLQLAQIAVPSKKVPGEHEMQVLMLVRTLGARHDVQVLMVVEQFAHGETQATQVVPPFNENPDAQLVQFVAEVTQVRQFALQARHAVVPLKN